MMKHTHLTQDERYQIAILAEGGHARNEHPSDKSPQPAIDREMKRC